MRRRRAERPKCAHRASERNGGQDRRLHSRQFREMPPSAGDPQDSRIRSSPMRALHRPPKYAGGILVDRSNSQIRHGRTGRSADSDALPSGYTLRANARPASKQPLENSCRYRRSIPALFSILYQIIHGCEDAITEDLFRARLEIRPFDRPWPSRFRHNASHDSIALFKLDDLTCLDPFHEERCVAQLTQINAWHGFNVTQNVTHCKTEPLQVPLSYNIISNLTKFPRFLDIVANVARPRERE